MASEASSSTAQPAPEAASDHLSVNLQVLSPSTAASSGRPLVFPSLPASTTVRQVKEKIRQALPLKPTDAQQRLIYRGRPLSQDGDTLLNVIGEEVIRNTDQQTIHLVLRDVAETHRSTTPTPALARGSSPAPPIAQFHVPVNPGHAHQHGSQPTAAAFTRRTPMPPTSNPLPFPTPSQIPSNLSLQQIQQMQAQQHQSMAAWMNGLQREAMNRAMANQQMNQQINHNQSLRASLGLHGIGDPNAPVNPADPTRGRVSPANPDSHTYVREGVMPNGQPYRVTVNETLLGGTLNVHGQPGTTPLSASEVQNILRGADAGQATLAMTNAMQRSASGTSLANGSVGVTTPFYPPGSRASSRRATPDPTARSVSGGSGHSANVQRQAPSGPEVYILNSPQGPRALLINNNSETYYTPTARMPYQPISTFHQTASALARMRGRPRHVAWPTFATPQAQQDEHQPAQPAEPVQAPPQPEAHPQGQPPIAAVPAHPNNPGIAPLIAQVWPHFWLIVRLGLFVWWFTSPNASWSRWFTVVFIAFSIFVLNTGLLNGFFDQAVGPVRRHMENLIPLAAPNQPNEPVRARDAIIGADGRPDPARAAARLVDQRRHDNGNWLMDQVRRLERAGLLFLASIAPGVAERHIAHLEAEARAERQRREEAEAAAAAAAEAAANAENTEAQNEETAETRNETESGTSEAQQNHGEQRQEEQPQQQQQQQPLVVL